MSEKETISMAADPRQLKALYAAFRTLEKDANTELKTKVTAISAWTAVKVKAAAESAPMPKQATRVATTVRANKDRIPNITIGGSKARFSGGAVSGQVLFGSEFGAEKILAKPNNGSRRGANTFGKNRGRRFPDRSPNNDGYWIYPTLRKEQGAITKQWIAAVEGVLNNWSKG